MDYSFIKWFIQKKLREMETVILENAPIYEGHVDVSENLLYSDRFMISYEDGFFVINFEYGAPCTLVAITMNKLAPRFELSVGEPYYNSDGGEVYWGDECKEKYLTDLKERLTKERKAGSSTLRVVTKD